MNAVQANSNEAKTRSVDRSIKTVVGIDNAGLYHSALDLLGRLRFEGNRTTLVHVEAPVSAQIGLEALLYLRDEANSLEESIHLAGDRLLSRAAQEASDAGAGSDCERSYVLGHVSSGLMDTANRLHADLVAIGSRHHTLVEGFLLGSVGRSLAIHARQSFLVALGKNSKTPLRAVFATDHSEYANRCFQQFLGMRATGIDHLTIVTATESEVEDSLRNETGFNERTLCGMTEIENRCTSRGQKMVEQAETSGISASYRLVEGYPENALHASMKETESDLMILGSRGHSFLERMLIGSLALHEVVSENYSVLVLRKND